jgi:hypothetical protein
MIRTVGIDGFILGFENLLAVHLAIAMPQIQAPVKTIRANVSAGTL